MKAARSTGVIVAVTLLAALAIICATILILANKISGSNYAVLIGSFLGPVVMILLSAQVGDVQTKVNGQLSNLLAAKSGDTPSQEPATGPASP